MNTIVLDLETAHSTDDCRHCGCPQQTWEHRPCLHDDGHATIGWENKAALGLSVGCYYDYADSKIHWFDVDTLAETVREFVRRKPLMVSYNGISFDFPLMRGILRKQAETEIPTSEAPTLVAICDAFKLLADRSYDILAHIWRVDPQGKYAPGINTLGAVCEASGLGSKLGHGALAPRDWAAGKWASVLNYCQDDVYKTKGLFEMIRDGGPIRRTGRANIMLPPPMPWQNGASLEHV